MPDNRKKVEEIKDTFNSLIDINGPDHVLENLSTIMHERIESMLKKETISDSDASSLQKSYRDMLTTYYAISHY